MLILFILISSYIIIINGLYHGVSRLSPKEHEISGSIDAIFIKLKSCSIHDMEIFAYNEQNEWKLQGILKSRETTSLGSKIGHKMKYKVNDNEYQFELSKSKVLYSLQDATTTDEMRNEIDNENNYSIEYQKKHKRPWIGYYGPYGKRYTGQTSSERSAPLMFMYEALKAGDKYYKISDAYKWVNGNEIKEQTTYTLEVISSEPKVLVIKDFISDYEIDAIINAASSILTNSEVGSPSYGGNEYDTTQRSSTSCWLPRSSSKVTESIYCRAADILGIDRDKMNENSNAESIQVVHYDTDQQFNCHYDFTIDNEPCSRFLTLLVYLNDKEDDESGGETAFPKATSSSLGLSDDDKSKGFKIHAGKGSAVLFYNQLEDGNGDFLSLHSGLPVLKGEKWAMNIWVWS